MRTMVVWLWGIAGCAPEPLTEQGFADELWRLQCALDTCRTPDDSCAAEFVQPRTDCGFDPDLADACLGAVQGVIDAHGEVFEDVDGTLYCTCEAGSEACAAVPDASALPPECDAVCG